MKLSHPAIIMIDYIYTFVEFVVASVVWACWPLMCSVQGIHQKGHNLL